MRATDLFDNYLNGKLSAADKAGFENQLRNDEVFATAFNEHTLLLESLTTQAKHSDLKKQLKAIHKKNLVLIRGLFPLTGRNLCTPAWQNDCCCSEYRFNCRFKYRGRFKYRRLFIETTK